MPRRAAIAPDPMLQMRGHAAEASLLLRAMGNEQRLLILCQLVGGECAVGVLQEAGGLSQSALSQHLAKLREAGLVQARREGQSVFYSLPDGPVQRVMATLHGIYCGSRR
jgi:DNA-binding transcriptional ArsR family regulator